MVWSTTAPELLAMLKSSENATRILLCMRCQTHFNVKKFRVESRFIERCHECMKIITDLYDLISEEMRENDVIPKYLMDKLQ